MPVVSEKQRRAMEAAAHGHSTLGIPKKVAKEFLRRDSVQHAAGVMFVNDGGEILLLKRSPNEQNYPGYWALPGGGADDGETPEQAARREVMEETGYSDECPLKLLNSQFTPTGMVYDTFVAPVQSFEPTLNDEHTEYSWTPLNQLPDMLHPAVAALLADQLGIGADMQPDEWEALRNGFVKWTREEEAEGEHAEDKGFNEKDHPRKDDGKFTSGSGSTTTHSASDVYGLLANAEDKGGKKEVIALAESLAESQPELSDKIRETLSDLGYNNSFIKQKENKGNGERNEEKPKNIKRPPESTDYDSKESVDFIKSMIDEDPTAQWGIRVIPVEAAKAFVGKKLAKSKKWVDGKVTSKTLSGTSAIGIKTSDSVEKAISDLKKGGYFGDQVVLVKGENSEPGEDPGERVIEKPEVMAIFKNPHSFSNKKASDESMIGGAYDSNIFALDKQSVRNYDDDGRLRIEKANISKANVCPYYGHEIPDWQALRLDPDRIYQLYRDPGELAKAAKTFDGVQLLSEHVPVSAEDHQPDKIVGSVGTGVEFNPPYLQAPLIVWAKDAIDDIERELKKELSSGYRYRADMTPGMADGQRYDGVMRDIVGNHVSLVKEGRAGPDVVVGDSQIKEFPPMKLSKKAAQAKVFLRGYLAPKMAADQKIDLNPLLKDVTAANFGSKKPAIAAGIKAAVKGKLAADANLNDIASMLDTLEKEEMMEHESEMPGKDEEMDGETAMDNDMMKIMEMLRGKLSPEELAMVEAAMKKGATDEPPPFAGKPRVGGGMDADKPAEEMVSKAAMDAALKCVQIETQKAVTAQMNALSEAKEFVAPWVGKLTVAMDSAESVYKAALDSLGVNVAGVHPSAYKPILEAQPRKGERHRESLVVGDSAHKSVVVSADFSAKHPNLARVLGK